MAKFLVTVYESRDYRVVRQVEAKTDKEAKEMADDGQGLEVSSRRLETFNRIIEDVEPIF